MLLAVVLQLTAQETRALPPALGLANYAQTLEWLGAFAPALAGEVHDATAKPLTCSMLLDAPVRERQAQVVSGESYRVRLTTLTPALSGAVARQLNSNPPAHWPLHGCNFAVTGVVCDPQVDGLSGAVQPAEMAEQALLSAVAQPDTVMLDFLTPVAFRSAEMHVPLPLPGFVWGGLAARWNALFPAHSLDTGARQFAEEAVAISRFLLHSEKVALARGKAVIGATGWATYRAQTDDRYWLGVFNLLADFAFFAGVGVKTAMGCGQTMRRAALRGRGS